MPANRTVGSKSKQITIDIQGNIALLPAPNPRRSKYELPTIRENRPVKRAANSILYK